MTLEELKTGLMQIAMALIGLEVVAERLEQQEVMECIDGASTLLMQGALIVIGQLPHDEEEVEDNGNS